MTMTLEEKVEAARLSEDSARKAFKKADKALRSAVTKKENLEKQLFEETGRFDDIEWLIDNPDAPGQYEALEKWLSTGYGGSRWLRGVKASGYNANKDYSKTRQAFDLSLRDYSGCINTNLNDAEAFLESYIHLFKPLQDDEEYIRFSYGTGEYSGIHYVAYSLEKASWWTFRCQRSMEKDHLEHQSLRDALEFAKVKTKEIEND